jgi:hypothetical protein
VIEELVSFVLKLLGDFFYAWNEERWKEKVEGTAKQTKDPVGRREIPLALSVSDSYISFTFHHWRSSE